VSAAIDRVCWGQLACGGLALGLRLDAAEWRAGEPIEYGVAFANRGDRAREVVLYYDFDERFRTVVTLRHGASGRETIAGAVKPPFPTTSGYAIKVTLAPGEIHERAGAPLVLPAEFAGALELQLVHGGIPLERCELRSGVGELVLR